MKSRKLCILIQNKKINIIIAESNELYNLRNSTLKADVQFLNLENFYRLPTIQKTYQTERDAESFNTFIIDASNFNFESDDSSREKNDSIFLKIKQIV